MADEYDNYGGQNNFDNVGDSEGGANEDERKMFIGGVGWDTTVDDLTNYFSRYGAVARCTLKSEGASGQNRGFGFVIFQDKNTINKVLQDKNHVINGRVVDPKRALARGGKETERKIFVGGLDPTMTEDEVKTYFTRYGKVEYIDMPFDRVRNVRRGFCFITFDEDDAVDRAVSVPRQRIGTKDCDVKRGKTRDELVTSGDTRGMRGGRDRGRSSGGRGGRGGGGRNGGGDFGNGGGGGGYGGGGYGSGGGGYGGGGGGYGGGGGGYGGGGGGYGGGGYGGPPQGWQQAPMGGGGGYGMGGQQQYYGGGQGGYGGAGYSYDAYSAAAQQQQQQQAYGAPQAYSYQDYYGGQQAAASQQAAWAGNPAAAGYGQMAAAYGSSAYSGGAQQQQQQDSYYGKAKRGQSGSGGYHPYQR